MARFDVYRNEGRHAANTPYLLDVQSHLLSGLATRVVIPLRRKSTLPAGKRPENLMPEFCIEDIDCVLETTSLAAVPSRILLHKVANLADQQFAITAALDFLFQGF